MSHFGIIPPEPPRIVALPPLPDKFEVRVRAVLADMATHGQPSFVREAQRTAERQAWLYGFGRKYDDGRGVVTNAATPLKTWHFYLLAVDIVHVTLEDKAPSSYWRLLQTIVEANGLTSGMSWTNFRDGPHAQFGGMRQSPSARALALYAAGGVEAVQRAVGARE
jgi:hypothetical protein